MEKFEKVDFLYRQGVVELRSVCRKFFPETRGTNGLAFYGSKAEIVEKISNFDGDFGEIKSAFAELEKIKSEKPAADPAPTQANSVITSSVNAPQDKRAMIASALADLLSVGNNPAPEVDYSEIAKMIDEKIAAAKISRPVEIKVAENPAVKFDVHHKELENVIAFIANDVHVFLTGPAGSGKTSLAKQVAQAVNLSFYPVSVGGDTTKCDLMGYCDVNGNYHRTPVRDAFENGGVLLLDELDAGTPESLTCLNALLANGECAFPDGIIKKHVNFRCIATANTFGHGADRLYVGRNQIDEATLNRFSGKIFIDYDEDFENKIAPVESWTKQVQEWRKRAAALQARVVISPRASIDGGKMILAGMPAEKVKEFVVFSGMPADLRNKIDY